MWAQFSPFSIMTLCAMYRLPWVAHRKQRTCTPTHAHAFTHTCSLSPKSTALRRVHLDTHHSTTRFNCRKTKRRERGHSYYLLGGNLHPATMSAWWCELATFERPTRVFCSFRTWGRVLPPPCSIYKRAPRTTLSQTRRHQITYNSCVQGAAVNARKPHVKLHGAFCFHLAKGRLFFLC